MRNTGNMNVSREQIVGGIEAGKAMLGEIKKSIHDLNFCLAGTSPAIKLAEMCLEELCGDPHLPSDLPCAEAEIIECLRRNAVRLYRASAHAVRYTAQAEWPGEIDLHRDAYAEAHLEPEGIFIRLPLLGSRNARPGKKQRERAEAVLFRDEIVSAIERSEGFQSYDFSRYGSKLIQFLYVYSTTKPHLIIGNDNHDTKSIQDAVVLYLPGGDCGLCCANYSASTVSAAVPEGTYITVVAAENGIMSADDIIQKWVALHTESERKSARP